LVIGGISLTRKFITGRNFNFVVVNALYGAPHKKQKRKKRKRKKPAPPVLKIR
jgi:hypothetical protein